MNGTTIALCAIIFLQLLLGYWLAYQYEYIRKRLDLFQKILQQFLNASRRRGEKK